MNLIAAVLLLCAVYEDKWGTEMEACSPHLQVETAPERKEWRWDGSQLFWYDGDIKRIYIREVDDT